MGLNLRVVMAIAIVLVHQSRYSAPVAILGPFTIYTTVCSDIGKEAETRVVLAGRSRFRFARSFLPLPRVCLSV
jgi:hypothetical protein